MSTQRLHEILGEVGTSEDEEPSCAQSSEGQVWAPEDPVGSIIRQLARDAMNTNISEIADSHGTLSPGVLFDELKLDGVMIVCGSGYLMSQVREALGFDEPK